MKKWLTITMAGLICMASPVDAHQIYPYDAVCSPFATYIAKRQGDILTVVVDEEATTTDNGNKELAKETKLSAELKKFFLPQFTMSEGFSRIAGNGTTPGVAFDSKGEYRGRATNTSTHQFTTRIQVRMIEEVRPGEFVVRGTRCVNINGKPKRLYISGVIRQRDIAADNTIKSHQLADARVEIQGQVAKKDLKPGIVTRIYQSLF